MQLNTTVKGQEIEKRVSGRKQQKGKRAKVWQREWRGGDECGCVNVCERCLISAATWVTRYANPCIKTSADSLRQITNIFFLPPHLNGDRSVAPSFVMRSHACFFNLTLNINWKGRYKKLPDCEGKTRSVGRWIIVLTLSFNILHASHIWPGGPLSALLAFTLQFNSCLSI